MTDIADLMRRMAAAGAPIEAIAIAVEAIQSGNQEIEQRRKAERERKQRQRARQSRDSHGTVTGQSEDASPETKVSPTPPSKTQTPSPPYSPPPPTADFDAFWSEYPSKVGKGAARTAFSRAVKRIGGSNALAVLLAAMRRDRDTKRWREGFIPNPATWLNQDRWEDGVDPTARPPPVEVTQDVLDERIRHYRETGEWRQTWGPEPKELAA